ncbi:ATP-binding protein [Streptomyces sp. NPDC047108]|uniref:ATP-binding protein n=1 Tax=Streptomyces sp. NPDC047108 TaxID=3155025 RepID=UPI0033FBC377
MSLLDDHRRCEYAGEPGLTAVYDTGFRLASKPTAPFLARDRVARIMQRWGLDGGLRDNVTLVMSELTANAVLHASGEGNHVLVALSLGTRLRAEVTDADFRHEPEMQFSGASDEGGRGLLLVHALSADWGVRSYPPLGKTVWAEFALPGVS